MKTISDNSPQLGGIYIKKWAQWINKQRKTTQKMRGRQLKATTNSPRCRERVWTGQGRGQGVANDNDAMNGQARPGAIQNQKAVPLGSPEWDRERVGMALAVQFRPWIMTPTDPRLRVACVAHKNTHLKTITCSYCTHTHMEIPLMVIDMLYITIIW